MNPDIQEIPKLMVILDIVFINMQENGICVIIMIIKMWVLTVVIVEIHGATLKH